MEISESGIMNLKDQAKCLIVIFVSIFSEGNSEVINISTEVSRVLERLNEDILTMGKTSQTVDPGIINGNISYSQGLLLGLNSMVNTGNCLLIKNTTSTSYDLHLGFILLSVFLPDVNFRGSHFSAYFRVRANSFNILFSIPNDGECKVNMASVEMVAAALVQNGSSMEEFDQLQLDGFFQERVVPKINEILKGYYPDIEKKLQTNCEALRIFEKNIDLPQLLTI